MKPMRAVLNFIPHNHIHQILDDSEIMVHVYNYSIHIGIVFENMFDVSYLFIF